MIERWPCECGHKHVSHGSFEAVTRRWVGIGLGSCGIDGCPCRGYMAQTPFAEGEPVSFTDAVRGRVDAGITSAPVREGEPYMVHVAGDPADEFYFARENELETRLVNHFGGTPMYDEEACSTCGGTKALHVGPSLGDAIGFDCTGYTD